MDILWETLKWGFSGLFPFILSIAYEKYKQAAITAKAAASDQHAAEAADFDPIQQLPFWKRTFKKWWPLLIVGIATANYLYGGLGSDIHSVFLDTSILMAISYYFYVRFINSYRHRVGSSTKLVVIAVTALAISVPFLVKLSLALHRAIGKETRFEYRVDNFLEYRYRLYNSPYLPPWAYFELKDVLCLPSFPDLPDYVHVFDSASVTAYHFGTTAVLDYRYYQRSYDSGLASFAAVNHGESAATHLKSYISYYKIPQMDSIKLDTFELLSDFRGTAIYSRIFVDAGQCFGQRFMSPGSMKDTSCGDTFEYDGFVFDLRSLVHEPMTFKIRLVTDRALLGVRLYRLQRQQDLLGWLKADPLYPQRDRQALDLRPTRVDNSGELNLDVVKNWGVSFDANHLRVYDCEVPLDGHPSILLLRYQVKGGLSTSTQASPTLSINEKRRMQEIGLRPPQPQLEMERI